MSKSSIFLVGPVDEMSRLGGLGRLESQPTLTPSSGIPKKSLVSLKRTWDRTLSSGWVLVTFVTTHLFQFRFVHTVQYWHSICLTCRLTIAYIYKMVEDPAANIPLHPQVGAFGKGSMFVCT